MPRSKAEEEECVPSSLELRERLLPPMEPAKATPPAAEGDICVVHRGVVAADEVASEGIIDADPDRDESEQYLRAARRGASAEVARLLEADPQLLSAVDSEGNTALHLATVNAHDDLVQQLLTYSRNTCDRVAEVAFVERKNDAGLTAMELSLKRRHKKISWTFIQSGFAGQVSSSSLFDSLPEFDNGNNFLHVYARNNYSQQIKDYADSCADRGTFVRLCLSANGDGDLPVSVAARRRNKEALLALLQPFIVFSDTEELDTLLHTTNRWGQRLLTYVAHYDKSLTAAHGLLLEMEVTAHAGDALAVRKCLRHSLGSTASAAVSRDVLLRIGHRQTSFSRCLLLTRIFCVTFLLRIAFFGLDMATDVLLLRDYHEQWQREVERDSSATSLIAFPGQVVRPKDPCKEVRIVKSGEGSESGRVLSYYAQATQNITMGCYAGAIDGTTRFTVTLAILTLPFILYFFELLRFRVFSRWLERQTKTSDCSAASSKLVSFSIKPVVNAILWLMWAPIVFFRQFWFRYTFEASESEDRVEIHRRRHRRAALIASRAQLIEVITESSLQPLFQFYLVFQELLQFQVISNNSVAPRIRNELVQGFAIGLDFLLDLHRRQVASVLISLVTLAWSFTSQYRQNKENSMSLVASIVYFLHVCLLVAARLLAFEMFAFSLGPGRFDTAMAFVGFHALLMAALHFVFSDSLVQCGSGNKSFERGGNADGALRRQMRRILLVVDNCLLNGLANLYIHNNLEVYVQHTAGKWKCGDRRPSSPTPSPTLAEPSSPQLETSYVGSDVQQRTLVRQLIFEAIFLAENVAMVAVAGQTGPPDYLLLHSNMVTAVATLYTLGIALKLLYYLSCHPWSELVRPRSCRNLATSCVVFSRQLDLEVDMCSPSISLRPNRGEDMQRFRAVRHILPGLFAGQDRPEDSP